MLRTFEIHVFPRIGNLPAGKVTLHEWLDLLEKRATERPGIAERILINAKQMLKWAVKRRLIADSPLAGINAKEDLQIRKVVGARSLTDDEIVRVSSRRAHRSVGPARERGGKLRSGVPRE